MARGIGYCVRKWLVVLAFLLWMTASPAADSFDEHAQRGNAAMQKNDFATAEIEYRAVLATSPQLAEIRSNLGIALHMQGKFDQAEREFRAAVRMNPRLFVPNHFLGKRLFQTDRYPEARRFLETASVIKPDDVETRRWLGATYIGLKEYEKGIIEFRKILKQEPQNVDALYAIGKTYTELMEQSLKRLPKAPDNLYRNLMLLEARRSDPEWRSTAKALLGRLVETNPDFPGLRVRLGNLELEEGNLSEARRYFQDEMAVDALSFQSHFGLAQVWLALQNHANFSQELELAVSVRPEFFCPLRPLTVKVSAMDLETARQQAGASLSGKFLAAYLGKENSFCNEVDHYRQELAMKVKSSENVEELFREKRYEAVVSRLENSLSLNPTHTSEQLLLAQAYSESGNFASAAKVTAKLAGFPNASDNVFFLLCRSYQRLAVQWLEELERVAPDSYRAHQLMGETLLAKEDYAGAVSAFQTALGLDPNNAELTFQLAQGYYRMMNFPRAFELLQRSLEVDPLNAEAHYLLGEGLVYTKESEKAIPLLKRALELNPSITRAHAELGKAYLQGGEFDQAAKELELASSVEPSGDLYYLLFRAYTKLNQNDKAAIALAQSNKLREQERIRERRGLGQVQQLEK
jgi:tetratricopeptide (TPR) repeat protein